VMIKKNQSFNKPEWSLKITKADNGFILEAISYNPEDKIKKADVEYVIEEDNQDELKLYQRLIWEVLEYFGAPSSKHDRRIKVVIEKPDGKIERDAS